MDYIRDQEKAYLYKYLYIDISINTR